MQTTSRCHLPECVARVPVSLWGCWGLRVCSLDVAFMFTAVRSRPQPSATVRNRSRDPHMAVPLVSSAEGVIFGGFKCRVASFRVAGVSLRDIQTCFVRCRKSFCVAGAILLRRFRKISCSFRGRRCTLDVLRCVLFWESHCQGCASDKVQTHDIL